ncbi:hypothetical protein DPMN_072062 [Dreissena polymorpha]|uniref:Uncharacterized protein n=1 Tax=Dreissena polymorpha TaxID=45954 RepID=A0A9D3Z8T7_DREPO|nr:hypothetical protein DPMN_072062 [Dreissena polymorpha]
MERWQYGEKASESRLSVNTLRAESGSATPNSTTKSSTASGTRSAKTLTPSLDTSRNTRSSQKSVPTPTPADSSSRPAKKKTLRNQSSVESPRLRLPNLILHERNVLPRQHGWWRQKKLQALKAQSAPVERKTSPTKPSSQTDDEEETIVRKARPSRRSANSEVSLHIEKQCSCQA